MDQQTLPPDLSPSERLSLRYVAEGELHASELDWVAVQRLKQMGLVEERGLSTMTTKEGQRALGRIAAST
jgi:ribosomal protein S19E (S16A)